jgi:hypothetical protein
MNEENNKVDFKIATENYDDSGTMSTKRKSRSRERGPDKKPRTYRANSMNNFVQFKERPEKFAKYLKDVKGVGTTGNSGTVKVILILSGLMFAIFGGLWLYDHYKNGKDSRTENTY